MSLKHHIVPHFNQRDVMPVTILPFWEMPKAAVAAAAFTATELKPALASGDFKGKVGETLVVYAKTKQETRYLLLGLGKQSEITCDRLRQAYAAAASHVLKLSLTELSVVAPKLTDISSLKAESVMQAIADGVMLVNYTWPKQKKEALLFKKIQWINVSEASLPLIETCQVICEGVHFARDLINESAHTVTPEYLADLAIALADKRPDCLKATILTPHQLEQEKFGLLLAVAKGSAVPPRLIVLNYRGQAKSKDHTVLIGKGVTYDTGGLNLKPTGSMETMRADMAGAAAVLATVVTAASLKLPVNVSAVIPATENAIGSESFKPGDVFTAYDGTTVEIGNTDAEGRLILADAIGYTLKKLAPTRIIDIATLTGSIVVALGDEVAGLFSDHDSLATHLLAAAEKVGEPLWRMPLYPPYQEKLKSSVADLVNVGGRPGGSITAALFLQRFLTNKKVAWAHIDCAGPAFLDKAIREWPKHGVGFGVRIFIECLKSLKS